MTTPDSAGEDVAPCPSCGLPLPKGWVYRAGYEPHGLRTIPQTYGRGSYCDHIPAADRPMSPQFEPQNSELYTMFFALKATP